MRPSSGKTPAVLLVMGVSAAGKTTIARRLAERLGWSFLEADEFHSPANVAKMSAGIPLNDDDRAPWLDALRTEIERRLDAGDDVVLACSALRRAYRARLLAGLPRTATVFLHADRALIDRRLRGRDNHFMPAELLESQFATLETPKPIPQDEPLRLEPWTDRALAIDASAPAEQMVQEVIDRLETV